MGQKRANFCVLHAKKGHQLAKNTPPLLEVVVTNISYKDILGGSSRKELINWRWPCPPPPGNIWDFSCHFLPKKSGFKKNTTPGARHTPAHPHKQKYKFGVLEKCLVVLPIRCGDPGVCQAPGEVVYSDSQNKIPRQVPGSLQARHT